MIPEQRKRLLLVDDDPLIRKIISGQLVAAGYVVRTAVDGLDAITKLRAGPPDLIISDLTMPRMSGPELLEVVRKRFPQTRFMVISADPPDKMPAGVIADAYYQKSGFGFEHLLETISDLTGKLPLRTAPPPFDNEPVPARWDGNGHYIIHCEDCLREFSVPPVLRLRQDDNWATCGHCGNFVQFLVAEYSKES